MPIQNDEDTVAAAISSVLVQTFQDFELILVDDGSTDRSMSICRSFADRRIVIVRQPHRGRAAARNTGILHARGNYVALLASHDMWAPDKLVTHIAHLETDPGLGASTSAVILMDEFGKSTGVTQTPKTGPVTAGDVFCGRVVVNGSAPVFRWEMLIESALPEDAAGRHRVFDESLRYGEELECWTRLAVTSRFRFEAIDRPLTYSRIAAENSTLGVGRQLDLWQEVSDRIAHIAPEFVEACGAEARATELRSLARSCVQTRDRALGLTLICEAVSICPAMLWREPLSTTLTFLACLVMRLLPHDNLAQLLLLATPPIPGGLAL
jgi:glycosyltransferase involved in cell wall biosynthesis